MVISRATISGGAAHRLRDGAEPIERIGQQLSGQRLDRHLGKIAFARLTALQRRGQVALAEGGGSVSQRSIFDQPAAQLILVRLVGIARRGRNLARAA